MALRLVRKLGISVLFVITTAVIGVGIPLLWLYIAAEIQGAAGITRMTKETAVAVFPGIVISYVIVYVIVMYIIDWVMSRRGTAERIPPPRTRYPWLRSTGDEPARTEKPTGLEMVFIVAACAVSVAFTVWFFLWAGNPLPVS
jgi:hypothetical protein